MIEEKLGSYSIVRTVGTGAMGTVYQAEDRKNGSKVAIKVIRSRVLSDEVKRERFLQSLLKTSEIRHKNLCPILEIGDDDDDFYVIMPFLEGVTLEQRMNGGMLPWRDAVRVALSVVRSLDAVHAGGTVHRGVNPSNIWLLQDGSIMLTDCGLATFTEVHQARHRRPGAARHVYPRIPLSSLTYMSPEQIRGEIVDRRTDVFSLGIVLYLMLTGAHPFEPRSAYGRAGPPVPSFPVELHAILDKTLAWNPDRRYQCMRDLILDLNCVSAIHPAETRSFGPRIRTSHTRRARVAALALLLVILTVLVYYLLVH